MTTTPPDRRTDDLREEIATAISTGRELGPEFDAELADSVAARMELAPRTEGQPAPKSQRKSAPRSPGRSGPEGEVAWLGSSAPAARTLRVAGVGTVGIFLAAWAAESTPEALSPWAILAVVAVVLHVVRTWRS